MTKGIMDYSLTVSFTTEQLNTLTATGMSVVIGKPDTSGNLPNVAWIAFKAFAQNTLSWNDQYGIYVATQLPQTGVKIVQAANVPIPAAQAKLYAFQDTGAITGPGTGGASGAYSLINQYSALAYVTAGLTQNATVNSQAVNSQAVNAIPVILQGTMQVTPSAVAYIWLQSQISGDCLISTVTTPMTKLPFSSSISSISVAYDSASGTFLPTGSSQAMMQSAGVSVQIIQPSL